MIADGYDNVPKGAGTRNDMLLDDENVNDTVRGFDTKVGRMINESEGRALQNNSQPATMTAMPKKQTQELDLGDVEEFSANEDEGPTIPGGHQRTLGYSQSFTEKTRTQ